MISTGRDLSALRYRALMSRANGLWAATQARR